MAHYKVLARKYRPSDLSELKGQEVFVSILNNSIKYNKLAHAYLLTGIRGVGKTSIARIIAKTINCESPEIKNDLTVPCTKCKNCNLVEAGNHSDILEFDAASRTGVSDIRDVIDSVHYASVFGKYKIYIIDEIHMLSNSAFNALLKILEEPPQNVIFIFATTEIRKVPLTVISRCQRFDLHRFNFSDISEHLEKVCEGEGVEYEKEALDIIAKHADGSMRDALTMLESVIAMANAKLIDSKLVREVLGINDIKSLYSLLYYLLIGNAVKSLDNAREMYSKGVEVSDIANDLLVIASKVSKYIASDKNDSVLYLLDSYEIDLIKKLCSNADISRLTIIWQILFKGIKELKFVDDALSAFEMIIVRCCYAASLPSLDEMMSTNIHKKAPMEEKQNSTMSFEDVVRLFFKNKEMILYHQLRSDVNCHECADGKLVLSLDERLPRDFVSNITNNLNKFTNKKWQIEILDIEVDKASTMEAKELYEVQNNAVIKEIFQEFPGTTIKNINESVQ